VQSGEGSVQNQQHARQKFSGLEWRDHAMRRELLADILV
jgi:hypothetical protein